MPTSSEKRAELQESLARWNQQFADFVVARCHGGEQPRADWRVAVDSAVQDAQRIVYRSAHPDDVDDARSAVSSLAGIWLSADEKDELIGEV